MTAIEDFDIQYLKRKARVLSVVTAILLVVVGCAAPDQHPFEQYSTSVKNADMSLVSSLDQAISWSRDDYIQSVLKGRTKLSQTAVLQEKEQFRLSLSSATGPV